MSEWREATLRDLVAEGVVAISDGYRVRNEELGPAGIPFVRGGDIGDGWINSSTTDHIRPELTDRVTSKLAGPGDVAFITKGTVGRAGRLRVGQPPVVFAPQVAHWRVLDRDILDPVFVFYLITDRTFQSALYGVMTHGAMVADYVSISQQLDFTIRIPDINSQRAIGHILGTLDDKIALNRRMNETLDAMVRALFDSWFVDFTPVRARSASRDAVFHGTQTDLFPSAFGNSVIGDIPEGWTVGTLADYAALNPESWSKDTAPATVEYVDLANTKWGVIENTQVHAWADAPSRAQRVLRHGDTIVGTVRPGNGSYAFVTEDGLTGSTGFAVLRPSKKDYREFVYLTVTRPANIAALAHLADGGAYPAVRPDVVISTQTVCPPEVVLARFANTASALLAKMALTGREGRTLADLRNALLPKLISGELRVKDAVSIVDTEGVVA